MHRPRRSSPHLTSGVGEYELNSGDKESAVPTLGPASDFFQEVQELKKLVIAQQQQIRLLERNMYSFNTVVDTTYTTLSDKVNKMEQELSGKGGALVPVASSGRNSIDTNSSDAKLDKLCARLEAMIAERATSASVTEMARSMFNSSRVVDQQLQAVKDVSSRALYSAEVMLLAILSQGGSDVSSFPAPGVPGYVCMYVCTTVFLFALR